MAEQHFLLSPKCRELTFADLAKDVAVKALADGLLINVTAERVLRIAPPLVVTDAEIDEGLAILGRALAA